MQQAINAGKGKVTRRPAEKRDRIVTPPEPDMPPDERQDEWGEGQAVELVIGDRTAIGYKAMINNSREGLLYENEVFQPLSKGEHIAGYIKKVRDDGKIDLCLQKPGIERIDEVSRKIIDALKAQGGFIAVDDKSQPELVYRLFGVSKKTYKKAVGALYRQRRILIETEGIRLASYKRT